VVAGLALSVAGYWVFFKKVKYVSTAEYAERIRAAGRTWLA
jgi:hypothetical protein